VGLFKKLGDAAKKGASSAGNAAITAATQAAKQMNAQKAKKLSEKVLGEERTKQIIETGEKVNKAAEDTVGKERLDAAKNGARSASTLAVVGGPKTVAAFAAGGALIGLATGKDVVGDIASVFMGNDEEDNLPETPKTPDAANQDMPQAPEAGTPQQPQTQQPKAQKPQGPKAPKRP
jgi:hypothetical protein